MEFLEPGELRDGDLVRMLVGRRQLPPGATTARSAAIGSLFEPSWLYSFQR